jgi:4a-hydroxytetrahydrobiopterin dehydratase
MTKLDPARLQSELRSLPGWMAEGSRMRRVYTFESFRKAIEFINEVANEADSMDHHPDIFNSYDRVEIGLTSHDEGGITERDVELARRIERVARVFGAE